MPDINPAALSRPSINISTPVLASKTITVSAPGSQKVTKSSQIIPPRIDLEQLYTGLKSSLGPEQWLVYRAAVSEFIHGRLNQNEYADIVDPILTVHPDRQHLHNQLVAAIYGNVTREMPDQGLAPWVSANDKPTVVVGSKPVTGDAAERRLKGQVMQLPARDRRRLKDLAQNDFDPYESLARAFGGPPRWPSRTADIPPSAGGINNMNLDLEIRKRFAPPLAIESGEFPDAGVIEGRMLPFCYELGLTSGHSSEAAQFMSIASETFIKDVMASIFSRTRSNGPGESGSAGFGVSTAWVQTRQYKRQLAREEDASLNGEIARDKSGLLPVEAKAAAERGPLGMADVRLALELADVGLANFPVLSTAVVYGYREGELENWDDYTWIPGLDRMDIDKEGELLPVSVNGGLARVTELPNGHADAMDIDNDIWWEGAEPQHLSGLDNVLDSCLAVG